MKKSYTLMALALAVGLSANAAPVKNSPAASRAEATVSNVLIEDVMNVTPKANKIKRNGPAKKVTKVSDLYGVYNWEFVGRLESNVGPNVYSMSIEAGDNENEIHLIGFPYSDTPIKANVNLAAGTVTIPNQDLMFNTNYNEMMKVIFKTLVVENGKIVNEIPLSTGAVGTISEYGDIEFPEYTQYEVSISKGYFWVSYGNALMAPVYFEFNAADWESKGKGQFTDVWINPLLESYTSKDPSIKPVKNVEVEIMAGKAANNKGHLLIVDPYASKEWKSMFNQGDGKGYIYLNAENQDCVLVMPLVGSGMWEDQAEQGQPQQLEQYFMMNEEGIRYYLQDYDIDEIIEEYAAIEAPVTRIEGNTVILENPKFGMTSAPTSQYWWVDADRKSLEYKPGSVVLPDGAIAGVESVEIDENAPVKIYNLQGQEVTNPAKGQLVIIKQGSKAVKTFSK